MTYALFRVPGGNADDPQNWVSTREKDPTPALCPSTPPGYPELPADSNKGFPIAGQQCASLMFPSLCRPHHHSSRNTQIAAPHCLGHQQGQSPQPRCVAPQTPGLQLQKQKGWAGTDCLASLCHCPGYCGNWGSNTLPSLSPHPTQQGHCKTSSSHTQFQAAAR